MRGLQRLSGLLDVLMSTLSVARAEDGNVQDVLTEAQRHLKPEPLGQQPVKQSVKQSVKLRWGISGSLRALECTESRIHKIYRRLRLMKAES